MVKQLIFKGGLLTTVFSHIINVIEKEYLGRIFELFAHRVFEDQIEHKTLLPFVYYKKTQRKELYIQKKGKHSLMLNEWKTIIKAIKEENFADLTVTKLSFLTENGMITETLEKQLGKKLAPTKYVFLFQRSTSSAKESYIKRHLLQTMKPFVDKLNFKYATLDLTGIYTYQDYKTERKYNLLTTEGIRLEPKVIESVIKELFKPSIEIGGKNVKVRYIKWYELSEGKVLKVAGSKLL